MNETNQLTVEETIISNPTILTLINPELLDSAPPNLELLSAPIRRTFNIVSPESSPIDKEPFNAKKEIINILKNLMQKRINLRK